MAYVHKKDHKKVITDEEFMKLLYREKLNYRYTSNGPPDLGSSEKKAHIPIRPDPNSYVEPTNDDIAPYIPVPNITLPDPIPNQSDFDGFGGGDGGGGDASGDFGSL